MSACPRVYPDPAICPETYTIFVRDEAANLYRCPEHPVDEGDDPDPLHQLRLPIPTEQDAVVAPIVDQHELRKRAYADPGASPAWRCAA